MTGWRLGWMVVPDHLVDTMNRLSQNIYISPPTLSQLAAISAFQAFDELNGHIEVYRINREIVLRTLHELNLDTDISPSDGAFYVYVDLSRAGVTDALQLCNRLLDEAHVAVTPGVDFEDPSTGLGYKRVRFSFCRKTEEVEEGMRRFSNWWRRNMLLGNDGRGDASECVVPSEGESNG